MELEPDLLLYNKILSSCNILIGVAGLFLTITIILSILPLIRSNPHADIKLCLLVIIFDFLTCIVVVPSSIINLINHEILHNKILCQVDYFFFIGSVFLSVWLLAVVSIERVIVVIFHRKPAWPLLLGLIFFFVSFYLFTFIYGLLTDTIEPSRLWNYCFITAESKAGGVILSMISILSTLTIFIVIISYTSIAIYVLKVNLDIQNKTIQYDNGSSKNIKIAFIRMMLTVLAYIITNSFEIGLELREISILQERSLLEELICSVMQMCNVMVNSTIILISNEQASENFWKLIRFWNSNNR